MSLLSLPNELLLCIYDQIEYVDDANSLSQTCRLLYSLINPTLFSRFAELHAEEIVEFALEKGDHVLLKKLYDEVDILDYFESSLPDSVAANGHTEIARFLLDERICEVCPRGYREPLPLVVALVEGHLETARLLIARGADPDKQGTVPCKRTVFNADPSRQTANQPPLSIIAAQGPLESVQFLLDEAEPNLNFRDTNNWTALTHAAARGDLDIVKCLVDRGLEVKGPGGCNPLAIAAGRGHEDVASFLLEKGEKEDANFIDEQLTVSDLCMLAHREKRSMIRLLLNIDNLMKRIAAAGSSDLHHLLYVSAFAGFESCVQSVIERETEAGKRNAVDPLPSDLRYTRFSLIAAAREGHTRIFERLSAWAHAQESSDFCECVTEVLCDLSKKNRIRFLRDFLDSEPVKHLDPKILKAGLSSALGEAGAYEEVILLLLKRGAIDAADWDRQHTYRMLHDAIKQGNPQAVQLILELTGLNWPRIMTWSIVSWGFQSGPQGQTELVRRGWRFLGRKNLLELAVRSNCKDGASSLPMVRALLETNDGISKLRPTDSFYREPLRKAVSLNDIETVQYFLDLNIDPSWNHYSPLILAVRPSPEYKKCDEMVKLILSHGAQLNTDPHSPLLTSLAKITDDSSRFVLIQVMLDNGADPLCEHPLDLDDDSIHTTPLWESLRYGCQKYTKMLLREIEARGTQWNVDACIRKVKGRPDWELMTNALKYLEQHRCRMMYPCQ